MKKIYLTFSMLLMVAVTFAQSASILEVNSVTAKEIAPVINSGVAIDATDTLGLAEFGTSIFQYGAPTGFVFGTNDLLGELQPGVPIHQLNYEYAAGFIVNSSYNVIGAMMWFGGKADVSGNPADLKVKLYNLGDNKALATSQSTAPDALGPDQMQASVNLPFSDVDTASFNIPTFAFFSSPVWINEDFAIAVDIKDLYVTPADTVWLYADEDGDSDGEFTWTKLGFDINPTTFWALSTGMLQGGLDVNLGIFAIVAESPNGIEEQGFLNGVKMTTYPNPALSSNNVTIQYGLETSKENVEIRIYTLSGQVAYTAQLGSKASGLYNLNIPVGALAAGSYVYALEADGARIAKRMEILK